MPSAFDEEHLQALEARIRAKEDEARAAAEAGHAERAADLFEDAATAWGDFSYKLFVLSEDTTPLDQSDLLCRAGRAYLARADDLRHGAALVQALQPYMALRMEKMAAYCLGEAAKYFEHCGSVRTESGDPGGGRVALARAEACLVLRARLLQEYDPENPELRELRLFHLTRVRGKLDQARRLSRKKAAGKRRPRKGRRA